MSQKWVGIDKSSGAPLVVRKVREDWECMSLVHSLAPYFAALIDVCAILSGNLKLCQRDPSNLLR